jgi:hypothetical protein
MTTRKRAFFYIAAPILFWFIGMFPAVLTPDSFSVIGLIRSEEFNSFHTLSYLMFVWILSIGGKAIYLVALIQLFMNYLALYLSVRVFFRNYVSNTRIILVTSTLFATPFFGPISATIWKDNPFNSLTLIGLILLLENFYTDNYQFRNRKNLAAIGLLAVGSTFRHDGPWTLILFGIVLLTLGLVKIRRNGMKIVLIGVSLGFAFIFSLSISSVASGLVKSEPVPRYQKTLSFLLDLQYVNANHPEMLKPEIKASLDEISSGPSLEGAKSCSNTYNFWNPGFNQDAADKYVYEIPKFWLKSMDSNARDTILKARFCRTSSVTPWPISRVPEYGYWPTVGISPNSENFSHPIWAYPLYLAGYVWSYLWGINGNLIAWPGLHLTLTFFILLRLRSRNTISRPTVQVSALLLVYFFCRSAILFLSTASQEFRYLSGVYFLSLPLILFNVFSYVTKIKQERRSLRIDG